MISSLIRTNNQIEVIQLEKKDIIKLINKELEENPKVNSFEISKKYRIPFIIVETFKRKIEKIN